MDKQEKSTQENTQEPKLEHPKWFDPEKHRQGKNGAIFDRSTGRIVSGKYNLTKITSENSDPMRQRWLNNKLNDQVIGIIQGLGLEVDKDDIEDIRYKGGQARQALYQKLTQVFMKSEDIRGMSVALETLIKTDNRSESKGVVGSAISNTLIVLVSKYLSQQGEQGEQGEQGQQGELDVIDVVDVVDVIDMPALEPGLD